LPRTSSRPWRSRSAIRTGRRCRRSCTEGEPAGNRFVVNSQRINGTGLAVRASRASCGLFENAATCPVNSRSPSFFMEIWGTWVECIGQMGAGEATRRASSEALADASRAGHRAAARRSRDGLRRAYLPQTLLTPSWRRVTWRKRLCMDVVRDDRRQMWRHVEAGVRGTDGDGQRARVGRHRGPVQLVRVP